MTTVDRLRLRTILTSSGVTIGVLTAALLFAISGDAAAICVPTAYTLSPTAPASANWTTTSGLWMPPGGFPGCAPGDSATETNVAPIPPTIIINSAIPNPIIGLNLACNSCVIDIQPGGSLTIAGAGSIASGATLKVSGGTLAIATGGSLTFQPGSQFLMTAGFVDVQAGGQLTLDGAN